MKIKDMVGKKYVKVWVSEKSKTWELWVERKGYWENVWSGKESCCKKMWMEDMVEYVKVVSQVCMY